MMTGKSTMTSSTRASQNSLRLKTSRRQISKYKIAAGSKNSAVYLASNAKPVRNAHKKKRRKSLRFKKKRNTAALAVISKISIPSKKPVRLIQIEYADSVNSNTASSPVSFECNLAKVKYSNHVVAIPANPKDSSVANEL